MISAVGVVAVTLVDLARVQFATTLPDDVVFVHAEAADSPPEATA
jgi:hypothetical protein